MVVEEATPPPRPNGPRTERPVAHRGLSEELPPLRPCKDARTPSEALTRPRSDALGVDGTTPTPSDADFVGATIGGSGEGDVLEQLRQLQLKEQAAAGPERHWGDAERHARDVMEAFGHAVNESDIAEAASAVTEAIEKGEARAVDGDGFGLLHYAAMYGSIEAVSSLVRRKANINARTQVHETPLMLAAYYRHAEVIALLLAHKARPDLADWQGRTPLAAAKESRCGNGRDNHPQAQARCVEILSQRQKEDVARGPPKEAEELRKQGNGFFQKGSYDEAMAAYSLGLSFVDDAGLYANRAACHLQSQRFLEAKLDAQKAVGLAGEAGHKKASWRLAKACLALGELDKAEAAVKEALLRDSTDGALRQLKNEVVLERRRLRGDA
eukprot:gnl/TRDRNA2_/TRDRNA2_35078_c0_seq1.p1 gnl/TRDRNA2_/TRDRNA2_35078_c0~~gnl/TRDRNA2_/TRDRNA2_35078_c0_seq1.p1  ORF type:complete len:384 (+),score=112.18 gnl/TRDRNA2_/TRDRNA2_35078_c0_seq1:37-1188(+)